MLCGGKGEQTLANLTVDVQVPVFLCFFQDDASQRTIPLAADKKKHVKHANCMLPKERFEHDLACNGGSA